MFTTAKRDADLGTLGGYIALVKAITSFRAGTFTEADYTGYAPTARPAAAWGAAGATSPASGRQVANGSAVAFAANSGADSTIIGWAVMSAASGGTCDTIALRDTDPPVMGTAAVDDTITALAHGLETDQRVYVMAAPGAVMPAGLSEDTAYFVLASGLSADVFKLSTTSGGSAVNITAIGTAMFMPYKIVTVSAGATPSFDIGSLVVQN